jgi:hypothetical protein
MRMAGSPSSSAAGPAKRRGKRDQAHHLVVQPQLLKGDEATRHIITVLSPQ